MAGAVLPSGKAEAKLGPGSEERIAQLKALAQDGTPVPPEVQDLINNNPELKAKMDKALEEGGDVSAAQKDINEQILKILQDNKDQFSQEDLEYILASTTAAEGALPKGKVTVQTVHEMAERAKRGETSSGGGAGGETGTGEEEHLG